MTAENRWRQGRMRVSLGTAIGAGAECTATWMLCALAVPAVIILAVTILIGAMLSVG